MKRLTQNTTANDSAMTLIEIMVVVAIIGLLAAMAIPSVIKPRQASARNVCISNLRQIDNAKERWALESKKTSNDLPVDADLFGVDKYLKYKPICPGNGIYNLNPVGTRPDCTRSADGHVL